MKSLLLLIMVMALVSCKDYSTPYSTPCGEGDPEGTQKATSVSQSNGQDDDLVHINPLRNVFSPLGAADPFSF